MEYFLARRDLGYDIDAWDMVHADHKSVYLRGMVVVQQEEMRDLSVAINRGMSGQIADSILEAVAGDRMGDTSDDSGDDVVSLAEQGFNVRKV